MADNDGYDNIRVHGPDGRPRMLSEPCATCILLPGNRAGLRPGRLAEMVRNAVRGQGVIVCHSTLPIAARMLAQPVEPAICRGFADAYSTNYLRVMERLGGFIEVPPPSKDGGDRHGHR